MDTAFKPAYYYSQL